MSDALAEKDGYHLGNMNGKTWAIASYEKDFYYYTINHCSLI